MKKKGQIMMLLVFFIMVTIIILITAVLAPMGVLISTKFYGAGDKLLEQSTDSLSDISDPVMRQEINSSIQAARAQQVNNIEVSTAAYEWSWALVIILAALVLFIFTRRTVEYGGMI